MRNTQWKVIEKVKAQILTGNVLKTSFHTKTTCNTSIVKINSAKYKKLK